MVGSVLLLIFAGGMVTSTGAGLSVPDWPNTYGQFMFAFPISDMVGGILYEHGHRMIASVIGILTVVLALWLWRIESRTWMKRLGLAAVIAVILQGLLGGITVLFFLPTAVSVLHATVAQSFFLMIVALAYFSSREFLQAIPKPLSTASTWKVHKAAIFLTAAVFIQLVIGAVMRHTDSGLAFTDFPLMGGRLWPALDPQALTQLNASRWSLDLPEVTRSQILIHVAHRLGALLVFTGLCLMIIRARRFPEILGSIRRILWLMTTLVLLQISLGAFAVLTLKQPVLTTFHVLVGAMLLGAAFLLTLRLHRLYPTPAYARKILQLKPVVQT